MNLTFGAAPINMINIETQRVMKIDFPFIYHGITSLAVY